MLFTREQPLVKQSDHRPGNNRAQKTAPLLTNGVFTSWPWPYGSNLWCHGDISLTPDGSGHVLLQGDGINNWRIVILNHSPWAPVRGWKDIHTYTTETQTHTHTHWFNNIVIAWGLSFPFYVSKAYKHADRERKIDNHILNVFICRYF